MSDELRSLTQRLRNQASDQHLDVQRLRRHVAFERILAQLSADPHWVVKGGFCLELRLGVTARATRDLDLANDRPLPTSSHAVQDLLDEVLDQPETDGFRFSVELPKPMRQEMLDRTVWRCGVGVTFHREHFERVILDVVETLPELAAATDTLTVNSIIPGRHADTFAVQALDVHQHAAEKIHAYARVYAHDRASSRVKDLVDLVLLLESGLIDDQRWGARIRQTFAVRDAAGPPDHLDDPPEDWRRPYVAMAAGLGLGAENTAAAHALVNDAYRRALRTTERP